MTFMGDGAMIVFGIPEPRPGRCRPRLRGSLGSDRRCRDLDRGCSDLPAGRPELRVGAHYGRSCPAARARDPPAHHGDGRQRHRREPALMEVAKQHGARLAVSAEFLAALGGRQQGRQRVPTISRRRYPRPAPAHFRRPVDDARAGSPGMQGYRRQLRSQVAAVGAPLPGDRPRRPAPATHRRRTTRQPRCHVAIQAGGAEMVLQRDQGSDIRRPARPGPWPVARPAGTGRAHPAVAAAEPCSADQGRDPAQFRFEPAIAVVTDQVERALAGVASAASTWAEPEPRKAARLAR